MKEKILIALSDPNLVAHISSELTRLGYVSTIADSGEEALQKMHSEAPDLVLIDLVLTGKSGYDVLAEKTLDRLVTKIPIIIVSNAGVTVEMRRIPSTPSVRDYVIRAHVDVNEVMAKVSAVFGRTYTPRQEGIVLEPGKPAPSSKKILWVEDDKFLSSILFKKFESSGHKVLKASDGTEALKILETEVPDIIVLDILLPGMNGFDLLQQIKTQEKLRSIPVIMLSNLNKSSDVEKAKTLGAQKFMVKAAVSLDEIVREVDSLLKM